jgi:hypothetical protein
VTVIQGANAPTGAGASDLYRVANCPTGYHATGGGGWADNTASNLVSTFPSDNNGTPWPTATINATSWTAAWNDNDATERRAYVLCVPD